MKDIKIELSLRDIYPHSDDCSFYEAVEAEIKDMIKRETIKCFSSEIKGGLMREIVDNLQTQYDEKIKDRIEKEIETGIFKINGKDVYLAEKIEQKVNYYLCNYSVESKIEKMVERLFLKTIEDLENRYDIHFATQIIKKINDLGLLKDGAVDAIENK